MEEKWRAWGESSILRESLEAQDTSVRWGGSGEERDEGCSEWFGLLGWPSIWVCPALRMLGIIPVKPGQMATLQICTLSCVEDLGRRPCESRRITDLSVVSQNIAYTLAMSVSPGSLWEMQLLRPTLYLQAQTCMTARAPGDVRAHGLRKTALADPLSPRRLPPVKKKKKWSTGGEQNFWAAK